MIQKRKNRYAARGYVKGEQKWIGTFDTRKEAKQAERDFYREQRPTREETCDSFAERWLDAYPRSNAGTARTYKAAASRFADQFRGVRLADLDRLRARQWALDTPAQVVAVVRTMFSDALNDGLVLSNPFSGLRLKRSRGRKDLKPLTEQGLHELAEDARSSPCFDLAPMILFAGYTGMRVSECCALHWEDIDGDTIHVHRNFAGGTREPGPPKGGKSRTIVCPPGALAALREVPHRIGSLRIFHSAKGTPLYKDEVARYLRGVRPGFTFHELRHCCATMLLERGLYPWEVARQLGHTDGGKLVTDLYGHPDEAQQLQRIAQAWQTTFSEGQIKRTDNQAAILRTIQPLASSLSVANESHREENTA